MVDYPIAWQEEELGTGVEPRCIGLDVRKGPAGWGGSGKRGVNNYFSMRKKLQLMTEHIINQ